MMGLEGEGLYPGMQLDFLMQRLSVPDVFLWDFLKKTNYSSSLNATTYLHCHPDLRVEVPGTAGNLVGVTTSPQHVNNHNKFVLVPCQEVLCGPCGSKYCSIHLFINIYSCSNMN